MTGSDPDVRKEVPGSLRRVLQYALCAANAPMANPSLARCKIPVRFPRPPISISSKA